MDDPAATSGLVKLLLDELERIRNLNRELRTDIAATTHRRSSSAASEAVDDVLYALQQENGRLKAEVEAARLRVGPEQPSGANRVGDDAQGVAGTTVNVKTAKLVDRVARARDSYKRHKASKYELEESVIEAQTKLDEATAQREDAKQRLEQLDRELQQYKSSSKQMQQGATRGLHGMGLFDPSQFLRAPAVDATTDEEVIAWSVPVHATELPQAITNLHPAAYDMRRSGEVIWPSEPNSGSHCVLISPTHSYDAQANNYKGKWSPSCDSTPLHQPRELFYVKAQKWVYAGTYKYQHQAILPFGEIEVLEQFHKDDLLQRTIAHPAMTPPVLTDMMKDMYARGVLKIFCTGYRRVGFNRDLAEALQPSEGLQNGGSSSGKRRRNDAEMGPRKKHKK